MGAYDVILAESKAESISDISTKDVSIVIYAGMVGNCFAKKEEPMFSLDDVKAKVKRLEVEDFKRIGKEVNDFATEVYQDKSDTVSVEGNGHTQQKVLNVA